MMKIALLSDSPFFPTGYSNQAKLLAKYLRGKGHEIHFMANGHQGTTIKKAELMDGTKFDYTIYGQGKQPYFADLMSPLLKDIKPDIFMILLDTFMLHGDSKNPSNAWFLRVDTSPAQTMFWYPSDGGGGLPIGCENVLRKINHPVAMARFGQKQVKDYYNIDSHYIPHGTEKDRFTPLTDAQKDELRAKWGLQGKFVVGVVARNQGRKMVDRTIKALAIFNLIKEQIPEAMLFLHMDPDDPAQVFNIRTLINRYNLENRVVWSGMTALKGFDWQQMNEVYNLFDTFLLTTSGEGFGIPIIEAMSCKIPVLATDYTTTPELVKENKAGLGINLVSTPEADPFKVSMQEYDMLTMGGTLTGSWDVERGMCDIKDAADKLIYLYKNPDVRKKMGENGRKAVEEKYDFNTVVGPAWEKLMLEIVEKVK